MSNNSIGTKFTITCFGESHGRCIGVIIDGCPAGLRLTTGDIEKEVHNRKPISAQISTSRREEDKVEVLSGVFNDYTTGAPICLLVWNKDVNSDQTQRRRDVYSEVYYSVCALRAFKDPRAKSVIEKTRDRWKAISFNNPQIVEECEGALQELSAIEGTAQQKNPADS